MSRRNCRCQLGYLFYFLVLIGFPTAYTTVQDVMSYHTKKHRNIPTHLDNVNPVFTLSLTRYRGVE